MRQIDTKPRRRLDSGPVAGIGREPNRDKFQKVVEADRFLDRVIHRPVPFMQHPSGIQHLCLWEGVVLDCLTVPLG